jgi:hypothetical protein
MPGFYGTAMVLNTYYWCVSPHTNLRMVCAYHSPVVRGVRQGAAPSSPASMDAAAVELTTATAKTEAGTMTPALVIE